MSNKLDKIASNLTSEFKEEYGVETISQHLAFYYGVKAGMSAMRKEIIEEVKKEPSKFFETGHSFKNKVLWLLPRIGYF